MEKVFDIILKTREVFTNALKDFSIEQLNNIPDGFNNNIVWNFAHIIVTPQLLCYKLSGLPFTLDEALIDAYKKGTKPEGFVSKEAFDTLLELEKFTTIKLIEDYKAGIFKTYQPYINSFNVEQTCVEDAIKFSSVHDGLHLGAVRALRRLV